VRRRARVEATMIDVPPRQAELLRRHGLRLDKRLGQHFLVDGRVRRRIVDAVAELDGERVVELAAGAGSLTFALADAGWPVLALDLDPRMCSLLEAERGVRPIEVRRCDLADCDFTAMVDARPVVFVGNLPYQVTSPILFALLPALRRPAARGAVLMVQDEVARRMVAEVGTRESSVMTVLLQAEVNVRRLFRVRPGCFLPPPAVESAVVSLRPRRDRVELGEAGRALVKELFGERRKQIGGILRRRHGLRKPDLDSLEADCDISPRCRAENLSLEDFVRLRDWLRQRIPSDPKRTP
jgi:16S rRNA (adenine1518-N6/adenine1519-N6)-dimethyltransferase